MNLMVRNWCKAQSIDSYSWYFNHKLPGDNKGAWHSSVLWYFFGALENSWRPIKDVNYIYLIR